MKEALGRELTRNEKWCIWHVGDEVFSSIFNLSAIDYKSG